MAHKSKTQRKRAYDRKVARKETMRDADVLRVETFEGKTDALPKKAEHADKQPASKPAIVEFVEDVRSEMKRVTWPTRENVLQWTGIVVGALIFFGLYVAGLDAVITAGLVSFSGLAG